MTETNEDKKRVTCKRPHPNQRVCDLLETLYHEAVKTRSKHVPDLKQAISSLGKYPLPLSSGAECAILKGFDKYLCKYIDQHLNGHVSLNKKTKVYVPQHEVLAPSVEVEVTSEIKTGAVSKRNRKKNKQLITNTNKCLFNSEFGKPSTNKADTTAEVDTHSTSVTDSNKILTPNNTTSSCLIATDVATNINKNTTLASKMERNNNTKRSGCRYGFCARAAAGNMTPKILKTAARKEPPPYPLQNDWSVDDVIPGNDWGTLTNGAQQPIKKIYDKEITKCYNTVQVIHEDSSPTDSSASASSSDDENSEHKVSRQPDQCFQAITNNQQPPVYPNQPCNNMQQSAVIAHQSTSNIQHSNISQQPVNNPNSGCSHQDFVTCKLCKMITTASDAFKVFYKEKMQKEAEELENYIPPHKLYKPAYRSGAYAILVALLEQCNECPYRDCLTKAELIQKAQKHTDQSFTSPKPHSQSSAWSSAKRLINKGLIRLGNYEMRSEDYYILTVMGRTVAAELIKENTPRVTINDIIFHGKRNNRVPSFEEEVVLVPPPSLTQLNENANKVFIEMPPGTFEIIMLIDKREHFDCRLPASPNNYSRYEWRTLNIGDFLWVARSKKTGQELVLPYIVERKTLDDFCSSIKDGRYHEQKFRLRKCGLKTVMYLVENNKKHTQPTLPIASVTQAMNNMCIQDDFVIIKTISLEHTFRFLGLFSENLVHKFLPKFLRGCNSDTQGMELMTFEFFNNFSCKNKPLTVKDTFVKMLLQLKGLSVEKALAITEKYPTPRVLTKAYERCSDKEGELLLSRLKLNNFTRHVGPVVSKTIYKLFSKLEV